MNNDRGNIQYHEEHGRIAPKVKRTCQGQVTVDKLRRVSLTEVTEAGLPCDYNSSPRGMKRHEAHRNKGRNGRPYVCGY